VIGLVEVEKVKVGVCLCIMNYNDVLENSINGLPASGGSDIGGWITRAVNVVTLLAFGISFVMFAYSFIQLITSRGDPKAIKEPRDAMVWSGVGMVAALLLQAFKVILLKLLGFDETTFF
jgi:energy-converting hydrogenase Eha subunit E